MSGDVYGWADRWESYGSRGTLTARMTVPGEMGSLGNVKSACLERTNGAGEGPSQLPRDSDPLQRETSLSRSGAEPS